MCLEGVQECMTVCMDEWRMVCRDGVVRLAMGRRGRGKSADGGSFSWTRVILTGRGGDASMTGFLYVGNSSIRDCISARTPARWWGEASCAILVQIIRPFLCEDKVHAIETALHGYLLP